MKKIRHVELKDSEILTALEMNSIHFGGLRSPLGPDRIKKMAQTADEEVHITETDEAESKIP